MHHWQKTGTWWENLPGGPWGPVRPRWEKKAKKSKILKQFFKQTLGRRKKRQDYICLKSQHTSGASQLSTWYINWMLSCSSWNSCLQCAQSWDHKWSGIPFVFYFHCFLTLQRSSASINFKIRPEIFDRGGFLTKKTLFLFSVCFYLALLHLQKDLEGLGLLAFPWDLVHLGI